MATTMGARDGGVSLSASSGQRWGYPIGVGGADDAYGDGTMQQIFWDLGRVAEWPELMQAGETGDVPCPKPGRSGPTP